MSANTHILQTPEPLAKQGILGQIKEKQNYDKSTFYLPRHYLSKILKTLILQYIFEPVGMFY
jgi:hypothetical protein